MSVGSRRNAAVIGSLVLLCSLGFGDWTQLTSGTAAELKAVHFPEGTQVGYAVGADPAGGGAVIKTTDGGNTWAPQSPGTMNGLNSVYFIDNNTGYAVGMAATGIKTTDGGASWNPMTIPGTDVLNCVQFPDRSQTGYIGVHPRTSAAKYFKTTDGGATVWQEKSVGGALNWSRSIGFATDLIGVVVGNGGMVYGTTNGDSFAIQGANTTADIIAAAFSHDDPNRGYLIANDTLDGIIRFTNDFGATLWDTVRHYGVTAYYGLDMPTAEVAYFVGESAGVARIDRAVESLNVFRTTVPTGLMSPMYGVCFPNGADTGFAVGANGTILRTYNGGIPWIPGVAEGKAPAVARAGIRVMSNPCRHGIPLQADAGMRVSVFDATGRVVLSKPAAKGMNFLPLPTGAYFVKAGASTARAVVTD